MDDDPTRVIGGGLRFPGTNVGDGDVERQNRRHSIRHVGISKSVMVIPSVRYKDITPEDGRLGKVTSISGSQTVIWHDALTFVAKTPATYDDAHPKSNHSPGLNRRAAAGRHLSLIQSH